MVRNYSKKTLAKNALESLLLGLGRGESFEKYSRGHRKMLKQKMLQAKQDVKTYEELLKRNLQLENEWKKDKRKFVEKYASSKLKQAMEQNRKYKKTKS